VGDHLWWYVARSAGFVTLVSSGVAVVWGLLLSTRLLRDRRLPKWLLDLHRFLGALTVACLALHLGALVADSYVHFGPADLLVPFASSWRPTAVAWGVLAAYLLVVVEVTSLLRRRIPHRWWRAVHLTSFGSFVLSLVHAATAGSDTANWAYAAVAIALSLAVAFLAMVRVLEASWPSLRHRV